MLLLLNRNSWCCDCPGVLASKGGCWRLLSESQSLRNRGSLEWVMNLSSLLADCGRGRMSYGQTVGGSRSDYFCRLFGIRMLHIQATIDVAGGASMQVDRRFLPSYFCFFLCLILNLSCCLF
ncbi:unnamed protein product [Vicia faba]|uniref:Uncharacterized protein n=1 Tax=Vicia faba TaxID=3906 RepID=A0AAV0YHI6_VICFA|nr:unnamed protein product [Vicia faba]